MISSSSITVSFATWTFVLLMVVETTHALVGSPSPSFVKKAPKLKAAVLVPGFLTGSSDFAKLQKELSAQGLPTAVVPMATWEWMPCLGGRSARPILERIDFTVRHLVANNGDVDQIPQYQYTLLDALVDTWRNPGGLLEVGGSSRVDEYPVVDPCGTFPRPENDGEGTIALIGHSAGGWISRIYLSDRAYGGKAYQGHQRVHSLVTLGTPHGNAPGPAFEGVQWINREQGDELTSKSIPALSVAGSGYGGDRWGDLTQGAYTFCCPNGTDGTEYDGDGLTPLFSALAMPQSESLTLANVTHFCWSDVFGGDWVAPELSQDFKSGGQWYGSPNVVSQWVSWILEKTEM